MIAIDKEFDGGACIESLDLHWREGDSEEFFAHEECLSRPPAPRNGRRLVEQSQTKRVIGTGVRPADTRGLGYEGGWHLYSLVIHRPGM
jgi:hypothetical protein